MDTRRPTLVAREQWSSRSLEAATCATPRKPATNWSVEQVYHDHSHRVYCLALRLLGNEADAEDVAQEVLLQVVRKLDTFRGGAALTTWLHRVTVNAVLLLRRQRRNARKRELSFGAAGASPSDHPACDLTCAPDQMVLRQELTRCLERAIARLPVDYRVVYVAADVDGLGIEEISDRLGLSHAAVKSRLHRGRTRLRTILTPYIQGGPA